MRTTGFNRRLATALMAVGASLALPAAVDAACTRTLLCDAICFQIIECCGPTACCTTAWDGSVLVSQTCEPRG